MMGRVDVIIAANDSEIGLESTIVKIEDDNSLTLLRPGKVTVDDLLSVVDVVKIADSVTDKIKDGAVALSPGMKYKHYAPKAPLMLVDCSDAQYEDFIKNNNADTVAVLAYSEQLDSIHSAAPDVFCFDFGSKSDEADQAARLFSILRETDKQNFTAIYAPLPKTNGMGLALYNRMIRAAAHRIVRL
jgi:L-threonylcarbamoyladenylate synthase